MAGCSPATPDEPPLHDPTIAGPFAVGSRTETFVDPRGVELTVEIWYPAVAGTGGDPLFVFSTAEPEALIDDSAGPYPVIGFSHGFGGIRQQSLFLVEHLASHGYLVVAPDHPRNNIYDGVDTDSDVVAEVAYARPGDISSALDFLLDLGDRPDPLMGLVDGDRIGVTGHSFGGWTAMMLAGQAATGAPTSEGLPDTVPPSPWHLADDRISAAVAMAPGGAATNLPGAEETAIPLLYMGGVGDLTMPLLEQAAPLYEGTPAPTGLVSIDGAGHFTFSNMCQLYEPIGDGCGDDWIEPERAFFLINAYTTAWLGRYVLADERFQQWLTPGTALGGEATLELRL